MTSRTLVDPELFALLDLLPTMTFDAETLPLLRTPGRLPLFNEIPEQDGVERFEATCPGRDGAPDVLLVGYRPADRGPAPLPCFYHIHGGGYIIGTAAGLEPIHRAFVAQLGCALVSVEYRLAPETPFPGPLEDCYTGLSWLFAHAETLGIDPARIGIGGESAGGGLAAGLALLVRDRAEHRIAFQYLVYPMIDDRTCLGVDPNPHVGQFVWNAGSNVFGWESYLGQKPGGPDISAYAAAARAEDLAGLPPSFVSTGTLDLFVDEDIAYAHRLIRAGVPTELHVYPGAYHGFDLDQTAGVSQRMRRDGWDFLKRHLFHAHPAA
jgi:acetyl esterase/lipase